MPDANHIAAHVPTLLAGRLGGNLKPGGQLFNYGPGDYPTGYKGDTGKRFGVSQTRLWRTPSTASASITQEPEQEPAPPHRRNRANGQAGEQTHAEVLGDLAQLMSLL